MKLAALLAEIEAKQGEVTAFFDRADDEHDGDMPEPDQEAVIKLNQDIEALEKKALRAQELEGIRTAGERRTNDFQQTGQRPRMGNGGNPSDSEWRKASARKTIGQIVTLDEAFKSWLHEIRPRLNATAAKGFQFTSPAVDIPDVGLKELLGMGWKDLVTGASNTSGGALVFPDIQAGLDLLGRRPLNIRDIITIGQTNSDTVEYVQETSETNNAAVVGEATATSGSSGMLPESGLALVQVQTPVKDIGHWIPATTRALDDAGQMQTLIDNFLTFGVQESFENQVISGNGVGDNFTGIENTSGLQLQPFATDVLTTLRKARTLVRTVGRTSATAYLMHPNDWESIDLLTDNENRYYFGGPSVMGTPRLWGLPVVENEGVTEGRPMVGNFRTVVVWDRQQTSIQSTNAHADFFLRRLVAIMAVARAAMGVIRPVSIVRTDITP